MAVLSKPIPSTGETLPVVGLGSWITFNVGRDRKLLDESAAVMAAFFAAGGRLIDSSPMYGSAQATIGYGLRKLGDKAHVFAADKVWISNPASGPGQMEETRKQWGIDRIDLMQVHNLLSWERHMETLKAMKARGRLRYIGITTSEGRRHSAFEAVMAREPLDFIQVTYNPVDREVERRILPLARERGIAVLVNRPFQQGVLTQRLAGKPLPSIAQELDARSWAQLVLKFIISHTAVTCAIPATTRVDHVRENVAAARGRLPDASMRERIAAAIRQA